MDNINELTTNLKNLDMSKLQRYSLGIVVRDIVKGENVIDVYPIEKIPDVQPDLQKEEDIKANVDTGCGKITIELKKEKIIKATWLSLHQYNRITPPTVRKGEFVEIYRMSNADMFFWDTLNNNPILRKEEHIIYAISDKDQPDPNENIENMYYLEIDTFEKFIKLHTTNKYGEYTTFDMKIDTKNGNIKFSDGKGNNIVWDSTKDQYIMTLHNDYTLNTDKTIHTNTENETKNIKQNLIINLDHIAIQNSTTELITLLMEYIQTHIEEQHVGNLGIPTKLTAEFQAKYKDILNRLSTLKV